MPIFKDKKYKSMIYIEFTAKGLANVDMAMMKN